MTDMLELTGPSYDAMVDVCKDAVLRNPDNYKENSTEPSTPILGDLCPRACSGHGTCKDAKCTCDKGFYENDCSKDISKPPVLQNMLSSCDANKWPCKKISIVGDGYVDYEKLSCHISTFLVCILLPKLIHFITSFPLSRFSAFSYKVLAPDAHSL